MKARCWKEVSLLSTKVVYIRYSFFPLGPALTDRGLDTTVSERVTLRPLTAAEVGLFEWRNHTRSILSTVRLTCQPSVGSENGRGREGGGQENGLARH